MQAKITASRLSDLDLVVSMCRESLQAGLSDQNREFAREMLTATLFEKANRLVSGLLQGQPEPNWGRRRALAREALTEALEIDPQHGECHLLLARMEALPGGDTELGRKSADQALTLLAAAPARQSAAYLARSDFEEDPKARLKLLDQALEADPENYEALRERARTRLINGETDLALKDLSRLLERNGEDLEMLDAMARALAVQNKYDEAVEFVQKMMDLAPQMAEPYALRASINIMRERNQDALQDLDRAIEFAPDDAVHRLSRARLLGTLDRSEEALRDIEQVLNRHPESLIALSMKIGLLIELQKFAEASDEMQTLLQRDPENLELRQQLAGLYLAAKRPSQAIKLYTETLNRDSAPWEAYRGRADAYLSTGQHAEAVADYEQALQAEPKDQGTLNNLAWVLATSTIDKVRNGARAIELATTACEVTEYKQAHILSTLAAAYAETGDFEKAIQWSKKAVELGEGPVTEQLQAELESYQQAKPWREMNIVEEPTANLGTSYEDLDLEPSPKVTRQEKPSDQPVRVPSDP
jgi:tetratricopeptide (TPR) repeat protein